MNEKEEVETEAKERRKIEVSKKLKGKRRLKTNPTHNSTKKGKKGKVKVNLWKHRKIKIGQLIKERE